MKKITRKTTKTESTNPTPADDASPAKKTGSHGDKKILSIAIEPGLHRQLALCARCEGRSVTDLVVEAVSKGLKTRIASALETLKADLGE